MPRTSSPDGLADLLEKQSSVVSCGQLLALGMNDRAMQYRVRRGGPWQKLLPGVYLATTGVPSLHQKELAALLHHGIRSGPGVDVIDVRSCMGAGREGGGVSLRRGRGPFLLRRAGGRR